MPAEAFKRDSNFVPVIGGVTDDTDKDTTQIRVDSTTKRLLVETVEDNLGVPTTPTIYNVPCNLADTEYNQKLPSNTRKYKIYAMDWNKQYPFGDVLKYTFIAGYSGGTFVAVPPAAYPPPR